MMLLSITSIVLAAYVSPFLAHRAIIWMLGSIQLLSFLRALCSYVEKLFRLLHSGSYVSPRIISRLLFKWPQSVAYEIIGLFVLFPFQLSKSWTFIGIRCWLLTTFASPYLGYNHCHDWARISVLGRHCPARSYSCWCRNPWVYSKPPTAISLQVTNHADILYTTCLVFTTLLTVAAFDKNVWARDIESSPSPFPLPILFAFAFPCLARQSLVPSFAATELLTPRIACLCLPGCTCATKAQHSPPPTSLSRITPALPLGQPRREGTPSHKSSSSLTHSLVRIPDAAERRTSIAVTLEFR